MTAFVATYVADSLEFMKEIPAAPVTAVVTLPPYAPDRAAHVERSVSFAEGIKRILKPDGSFIHQVALSRGRPTGTLRDRAVCFPSASPTEVLNSSRLRPTRSRRNAISG